MAFKDKETENEWRRQRRLLHPGIDTEKVRRWRRKNKPHLARKQAEYYDNNPERYLYIVAKTRAKQRGVEFTIRLEDIVIPEACPVLGMVLERGQRGDCDSAPSLDRKDNSRGYVPGNVFVISRRANSIKSDATVEEMRAVTNYCREAVRRCHAKTQN